jgi:hypothetical protein
LAGRGEINRFGVRYGRRFLVLGLLIFAVLLGVLYRGEGTQIRSFINRADALFRSGSERKEPIIDAGPAARVKIQTRTQEPGPASNKKEEKNEDGARALVSEPTRTDKDELANLLMGITSRESRSGAMKTALALWSPRVEINPYLEGMKDDQAYFRLIAKQNGLLIHRLEGGWDLLEKLNIPAILEFRMRDGQGPRYLSFSHMEEGAITLGGMKEDTSIRVLSEDVQSHWSKVSYVLWKDYLDYPGTIPKRASSESVIALKMLLQEIGFKDIELSPFYDEKTRGAVMAVQEKHGIHVDGIVGPLTKILLYKEKVHLKKRRTF